MTMVNYQKACNMCGEMHYLVLTEESVEAYKQGALIQDAFPYLDDGSREIIKTGICGPCFDSIWEDE